MWVDKAVLFGFTDDAQVSLYRGPRVTASINLYVVKIVTGDLSRVYYALRAMSSGIGSSAPRNPVHSISS